MLDFTYNNRNSKEFKMYVMTSEHANAFERNLEFIKVPGKTGDLIVNDGSYLNKQFSTNTRVNTDNIATTRQELEMWLFANDNYKTLIFSDGIRIKAVCTGLTINKAYEDWYDVNISFNAMKG